MSNGTTRGSVGWAIKTNKENRDAIALGYIAVGVFVHGARVGGEVLLDCESPRGKLHNC